MGLHSHFTNIQHTPPNSFTKTLPNNFGLAQIQHSVTLPQTIAILHFLKNSDNAHQSLLHYPNVLKSQHLTTQDNGNLLKLCWLIKHYHSISQSNSPLDITLHVITYFLAFTPLTSIHILLLSFTFPICFPKYHAYLMSWQLACRSIQGAEN